MQPNERINEIKDRLTRSFTLTHLEIIDDSTHHHGHAGAASGAGYYTLIIGAGELQPLSRVDAHRLIYQVLHDLMETEIHALRIVIKA